MAQNTQAFLKDYTQHVKSTSTRQSRKFKDLDLDFGLVLDFFFDTLRLGFAFFLVISLPFPLLYDEGYSRL